MEPISIAILVLIGLVGGFTAGLLGIGGGVIMVPLLAFVGGLTFHAATAVSLVQVFMAAVSGVARHYRQGTVNVRIALLMGAGSVTSSAISSALAPSIPAFWLQTAFLLLVLASAVTLLMPKKEPPAGQPVKVATPTAVGLGVMAGCIAGTLGAGGGFALVPIMIYVLGMPTKLSIGTSLAVVLLGGLSGVVVKFGTGQIEVATALAVVAGGMVGAQLGALICHRTNPRVLRWSLSALLFVIAARTLAGLLGFV